MVSGTHHQATPSSAECSAALASAKRIDATYDSSSITYCHPTRTLPAHHVLTGSSHAGSSGWCMKWRCYPACTAMRSSCPPLTTSTPSSCTSKSTASRSVRLSNTQSGAPHLSRSYCMPAKCHTWHHSGSKLFMHDHRLGLGLLRSLATVHEGLMQCASHSAQPMQPCVILVKIFRRQSPRQTVQSAFKQRPMPWSPASVHGTWCSTLREQAHICDGMTNSRLAVSRRQRRWNCSNWSAEALGGGCSLWNQAHHNNKGQLHCLTACPAIMTKPHRLILIQRANSQSRLALQSSCSRTCQPNCKPCSSSACIRPPCLSLLSRSLVRP